MSNAQLVKQFTELSGATCADRPTPMSREEVQFLIQMCVSELVEFAQTVASDAEDAMQMVAKSVHVDLNNNYVQTTTTSELIGEQADALVDVWYYALNAFAKKGVNLSAIFNCVHAANMAKLWDDGTFHKDSRGKVIKPPTWQPPNITKEIDRQINDGPWS